MDSEVNFTLLLLRALTFIISGLVPNIVPFLKHILYICSRNVFFERVSHSHLSHIKNILVNLRLISFLVIVAITLTNSYEIDSTPKIHPCQQNHSRFFFYSTIA